MYVGTQTDTPIDCFYFIQAERKGRRENGGGILMHYGPKIVVTVSYSASMQVVTNAQMQMTIWLI